MKKLLRFVVIGDNGVGKSSLIATATTDVFPSNPAPVLPPIQLPPQFWSEPSPIQLIDTSSNPRDKDVVDRQIQSADIVLLCFGLDSLDSLSRIHTYWLPELRRLRVLVPVLMVGCKLDSSNVGTDEIHKRANRWMQDNTSVEAVVIVSAKQLIGVSDLIGMAINMVIYPVAPLYDDNQQQLTIPALKAFDRIFNTCDENKDGALNDDELQRFQILCYNTQLNQDEINGLKQIIAQRVEEGVKEEGVTLHGFIFLFIWFIQKSKAETVWTALRAFGYETDFSINEEFLNIGLINTQDQHVEASSKALDFVTTKFLQLDIDKSQTVNSENLDRLFKFCPRNPFHSQSNLRKQVQVQQDSDGNLSLHGYLSLWVYWCSVDPKSALEHFIYLGYGGVEAIETKYINLPNQLFKVHNIYKKKKDPHYLKEITNRIHFKVSLVSINQNISNKLQNGLVQEEIFQLSGQNSPFKQPQSQNKSSQDIQNQEFQQTQSETNNNNINLDDQNKNHSNGTNQDVTNSQQNSNINSPEKPPGNGKVQFEPQGTTEDDPLAQIIEPGVIQTALNVVLLEETKRFQVLQTYSLPYEQVQTFVELSGISGNFSQKFNHDTGAQSNKNPPYFPDQNLQHILEVSDLIVFVASRNKATEFKQTINILTQLSDKYKNQYPVVVVQLHAENQQVDPDSEQITKIFCQELRIATPLLYKMPRVNNQNGIVEYNIEQNQFVYQQILKAIYQSKGHYPQTPSLKKMLESRKMIRDIALVSGLSVGVGLLSYYIYYKISPAGERETSKLEFSKPFYKK